MKKNNQFFYIVESSQSYYVYDNKEEAVKKQTAIMLICREPVSLKVMKQNSIYDFLENKISKKNLSWRLSVCKA